MTTSLMINKTQVQNEKNLGKYGSEYSHNIASASDKPSWLGLTVKFRDSPQIYHFNHRCWPGSGTIIKSARYISGHLRILV